MYSPGKSASNSQTRILAALSSSAHSNHAKLSSPSTFIMSNGFFTERASLGLRAPQMVRVQIAGGDLTRYPVNRLSTALYCRRQKLGAMQKGAGLHGREFPQGKNEGSPDCEICARE